MPTTVRRRTCPARPAASPQNVANHLAVNAAAAPPSGPQSDPGGSAKESMGASPPRRQYQPPPMLPHPGRPINTPEPAPGHHHISKTYLSAQNPTAPPAPPTPQLRNTSSAAEPAQSSFSGLLFELIGASVKAIPLHFFPP